MYEPVGRVQFVVFEKFTSAYLFQIALEIMFWNQENASSWKTWKTLAKVFLQLYIIVCSWDPIIAGGSFENEDRSTKHPNLENEAPIDQKQRPVNLANEAP